MPAMKRKVHARIPITDDVEVHVSTVTANGQQFYEMRQYIPSLKRYSRGIAIPANPPHISADLITGLFTARGERR